MRRALPRVACNDRRQAPGPAGRGARRMEVQFTEEIKQLQLGAGATFHGEGILAITKALLQSGVAYIGGYQGAPVSHLLDVMVQARPYVDTLGVHVEACSNEASAAAMLGASIHYPLRGAVTWKSIVGTNVAADALSNLASPGVVGGALIVVGEDYGEGASVIQERTHAYALKSTLLLLDPRPDLPTMVNLVEHAFALSEASNMPAVMELRIRACHVRGRFECKDNVAPKQSTRAADRRAGRLRLHAARAPAGDLPAREAEDRAAHPGGAALHRRTQAQRTLRRRPLQGRRPDRAGRPLQRAAARAAATRAGGQLRCERPAGAGAQRDVPARARGDLVVLRRQARRAGGRGRQPGVHREGHRPGAAQARPAHAGARQGHAAAGRRVHRRGDRGGPADVRRPVPAAGRSERTARLAGRQRRTPCGRSRR